MNIFKKEKIHAGVVHTEYFQDAAKRKDKHHAIAHSTWALMSIHTQMFILRLKTGYPSLRFGASFGSNPTMDKVPTYPYSGQIALLNDDIANHFFEWEESGRCCAIADKDKVSEFCYKYGLPSRVVAIFSKEVEMGNFYITSDDIFSKLDWGGNDSYGIGKTEVEMEIEARQYRKRLGIKLED